MNTIIYEFDPVIYPYKVWVIVTKKTDIITDKFLTYDGDEIREFDKMCNKLSAYVFPVLTKDKTQYGVLIVFYSKACMTYEIVAHESSHAAKYLFNHINADMTEHEPFEYVVGWIARCIGNIKLNKK